MPKKYFSKSHLYCFSPPVMLATMLIEFGGAIYSIWRYRLDKTARIMALALIALGVFQLAEYFICEQIGFAGLNWARLGFVAITLLPPLGISAAMSIARQPNRAAETIMYLCCAAFVIYYGFFSGALTSETCQGNYVIFTGDKQAGPLYTLYYFSQLAVGTYLSFKWAKTSTNQKQRRALFGLALGYLVFIIPTTIVASIDPATRAAIPSVMCGFAVLLALSIIFIVLPNAGLKRQ